ncbi:hypothetical protein KLEA5_gp23 [Aeromonas phage vB_AveS_KLEA5]|nr:hypothetical protein KLEA5_gp23 [Aeromonas phage vB_AveS_KLEA5]
MMVMYVDRYMVGTCKHTGRAAIAYHYCGEWYIEVKPENHHPEYLPDESDKEWVERILAFLNITDQPRLPALHPVLNGVD